MTGPEAMADEFDTLPVWTAASIDDLGPDHAIAAACRGSGNPAALTWFIEQLGLERGTSLLDVGAGMGGAGEFAARASNARATLCDPMMGACRAAEHLFGRPVVAATGEQLPFRDNSFDTAWALGVLCTSDDQPAMVRELVRVVKPGGLIGLLVFVTVTEQLPEQPDGNNFPTRDGLDLMIYDAGMDIRVRAELSDFPSPLAEWQNCVDEVDELVARRHRHDQRWQRAHDQEMIITRLITDELVNGVVLILESRSAISRAARATTASMRTKSTSTARTPSVR